MDEHAAALYRAPPADFVAGRDERVKQLRASGDREAAKQVSGLRRPTVGAWLVNLLVLDEPGLPGQLTGLAGELVEAQDRLAGDELRALGRRRQELVSGLVARARTLGREAGGRATEGALVEVESTLRAALADPDVAREVLSGRLLHARDFAGFGPAPTRAPERTARAKPVAQRQPRERREAEERRERARAAVEEADTRHREAADRLAEAAAALATAEQQVATSRSAHKEAQAALRRAAADLKAAQSALRRLG